MRDLSGIAAIVTGGASGLGRATAQALAFAGAKVAALDRLPGPLEPGILPIACDVVDEASVIAALNLAEAAHGIARIVVNCAGIPDQCGWSAGTAPWTWPGSGKSSVSTFLERLAS